MAVHVRTTWRWRRSSSGPQYCITFCTRTSFMTFKDICLFTPNMNYTSPKITKGCFARPRWPEFSGLRTVVKIVRTEMFSCTQKVARLTNLIMRFMQPHMHSSLARKPMGSLQQFFWFLHLNQPNVSCISTWAPNHNWWNFSGRF